MALVPCGKDSSSSEQLSQLGSDRFLHARTLERSFCGVELNDKLAGLAALIAFLAALGADLYEHFVQSAPNNVFMAASGAWTAWFDVSVFALAALEVLGISSGILLLRGRPGHNSQRRDAIQMSRNNAPGA